MDLSDITDSDQEAPRTRRRLISPEEDDDLDEMDLLHRQPTSTSHDNRARDALRNGGRTSTSNSNHQRAGAFRSASDLLRADARGSSTTDAVHDTSAYSSSSSSRPRVTRAPIAPAVTSAASETEDEDIDHGPTFKPETLHAIFKQVWSDPGTKAGKEALQLSAEYLRLFTVEALHRTALLQREGESEELQDEKMVLELDTLESITPQLVLDF